MTVRFNILALLVAVCPLAAQSGLQDFGIWPGVAGFSTRAHLPLSSHGEVAVQMHRDRFRAVGAQAHDAFGVLEGLRTIVQNQDAGRGMPITILVLGDGSEGGPEATNVLITTGPIQTPEVPGTAAAFDLRISFATPARIVPLDRSWSLAVQLPAAIEGSIMSVHSAASAIGARGDNAKPSAPSVLRTSDATTGLVFPVRDRTLAVFGRTRAPVLHVGADVAPALQRGPNPAFGMAGLYPSRARQDGLAFRVQHEESPGAMCVVLGTPLGFASTPLRLGGIGGALMLMPPLMPSALVVGTLDGQGGLSTVSPLAPYPFATGFTQLQFQAIVVPQSSLAALTNAVAADDS